MQFLDRNNELQRLDRLVENAEGGLAVVWGRRRIGKTRLLLEWCQHHGGCYAVADRSASAVQRRYLAQALAPTFPGLSDVEYPDWRALLTTIARRARGDGFTGPLVLDEVPYLVAADPALPSVLQAWLDHEAREARLVVALAGSTQHMMQSLVLDSAAPLYGRASQLLHLDPLPAGYLGQGLALRDPLDSVRAWSAWGGVPRYWELARSALAHAQDLADAVDELMLDPLGPLHEEPDRLLSAELPPAMSLRPLLDVIGAGAHRLSEIGGRLGRNATSLSRPLARLVELGLLRREVPYGVSERTSKRSLYRIDDPFLRAWFRVVAPNRAQLAHASPGARKRLWRRHEASLGAAAYEDLCRQVTTAGLHRGDATLGRDATLGGDTTLGREGPFLPAGRLWDRNGPEWDVVAHREDRTALLLGEVKWSATRDLDARAVEREVTALLRKGAPRATDLANLPVIHALFVGRLTPAARKRAQARGFAAHVIEARDVLAGLR